MILGLVGAATPFLNARPYTLLGSTVHSSGSATPVLRIARAKGNIVLDIEDARAAHTLIAAMRTGGSGDNHVYARISRTREAALTPLTCPGPMSAVFRITGGDPAKGGVAVDTLSDIPPGCFIQFLVAKSAPLSDNLMLDLSSGLSVAFGALSDSDCGGNTHIQSGVLSAATEGGFVYAHPSKPATGTGLFSGPTECAVPGSTATLSL
ncbi:hypothetical protein IWW38_000767 [Coemansia aciculifera]|uniref:Uncharacterized protein n=1 Tax=Coemansia aciculifera TaxID=417176 RepID=A0ACC1M8T1_9FUNG|nr:hypothetical protein IWW38_000767 [Coemansia aciculifera]